MIVSMRIWAAALAAGGLAFAATFALSPVYVSTARVALDLHEAYRIKDPEILAAAASRLAAEGQGGGVVNGDDLGRKIFFTPYQATLTGISIEGSSPAIAQRTAELLLEELELSWLPTEAEKVLVAARESQFEDLAGINARAFKALLPLIPLYRDHPDPRVSARGSDDYDSLLYGIWYLGLFIEPPADDHRGYVLTPPDLPSSSRPTSHMRAVIASLVAVAVLLAALCWSIFSPARRRIDPGAR